MAKDYTSTLNLPSKEVDKVFPMRANLPVREPGMLEKWQNEELYAELRKKNNLTQQELGEVLNVSYQTISKWELGETSPDLEQSKKLSKIFNVSLDELTDNSIKDVVIEKVSNTEKLAGLILKLIRIFIIG